MKFILLKLIAVLAITSLACQVSVNLPVSQPGEMKTFTVSEPSPAGDQVARLELEMGAGELTLDGGSNELVSGTITYNLDGWEPDVERNGDVVRIRQNIQTLPIPEGEEDIINRWELQLGSTPMQMEIRAGAYDGELNLGGVPLVSLDIRGGASNTVINFDEPNPREMTAFNMEAGASNIELQNLANANFAYMEFSGAAGNYSLDFGGNLQRDADVDISGAVGEMTIIIPAGQAARVKVTGGLSEVDTRGDWDFAGDVYITPGSGPLLEINVEMSIGSLELISE